MTTEKIAEIISGIAEEYCIKNVKLFGSRANGTSSENSAVDLIVEFYSPVTLITISKLQYRLEELLCLDVDIVH
jgi:hypothetical protein